MSAGPASERRRSTSVAWVVLVVVALVAIVVWPSTCDAAASVAVTAKAGSSLAVSQATDQAGDLLHAAEQAPSVTIHHVASIAPLRGQPPTVRVLLAVVLAALALLVVGIETIPTQRRRERLVLRVGLAARAAGRAPPQL